MMQYRFRVILMLILGLNYIITIKPLNAGLLNIDRQFQSTFSKLSESYNEQFPVRDTKQGLVILPFAENSPSARENGLGSTLRDILIEKVLLSSQIFYLVDRETLQEALNEIQLSQTGLVDENQVVQAGNLVGANTFLSGSISELKGDFIINIKIINVGTGTVAALEKLQIPKADLIQMDKLLALETISQYGLGINFQWSIGNIKSPESNFLHFSDVFVNYRPFLWLNFKLGVSAMSLNFNSRQVAADKVYPTLFEKAEPLISSLDYSGGNLTSVSPYVGLDYNYMYNQKFSVALGFSYIFASSELEQQYRNGVFFDDDDGLVHKMKTFKVEQELDFMHLFRIEFKPQFYISPRMTIGLYAAYLLGPEVKIDRSVINDDYREFPHEGDRAPAEFRQKYFEMSTKILGNGNNLEDVSFMSGTSFGMSFNFYF